MGFNTQRLLGVISYADPMLNIPLQLWALVVSRGCSPTLRSTGVV